MTNILSIILLAVIQGVTEFLPISSSGHLVLAQELFGLRIPGAGLEIALHAGTLVSILVYYWKDLRKLVGPVFKSDITEKRVSLKRIALLLIASVPIAVLGLIFESRILRLFEIPRFAAAMLLVTAIILGLTALVRTRKTEFDIGRAVVIGFAQAFALLPGISRSGSTIAIARLLGVEPEEAARFSFILAIPAIFGATIFEFVKYNGDIRSTFLIGTAISAIVGFFSLKLTIGVLRAGKFWVFALYCAIVGVIGLTFI